MRVILGVVMSACLLVGCGGVVEAQPEESGPEAPAQLTICSAGCEMTRIACLEAANGNAAAQEECMQDYRVCIKACTPWRDVAATSPDVELAEAGLVLTR